MIKSKIQFLLQKLFGFERYLYIFSRFIIKKLRWDKKEKDFIIFMDLLPNEGLILDLGANIGVMSYHLANSKPNAKIYAFEPIPVNYRNIERLISRFKIANIELKKFALGDTSGEVEMVLPVVESVKKHGLSHVVHDTIDEFNQGETFKVPLKQLDELDFLQKDAINGIKIDVENFEYFVLNGAKQLIKKNEPVIYAELWEGENRTNTFNLLTNLDYSVNVVENGVLIPFTDQVKQNFIFLPKQK